MFKSIVGTPPQIIQIRMSETPLAPKSNKRAKPALNVIQTMTVSNEPCYVRDNGVSEPYIPKEITGHREAYAASLHILFKHMADFHITVIEIIAEKYKLSADEMIETIHKDPRYTDMHVNPILSDLSYVNAEDVAKAVPSKKAIPSKADRYGC
jgi:hypothetical protein